MNPRQKARDLVELALDEGASERERMSAALRVVTLIKKYDLLSSPLDALLKVDNETVREAAGIFSDVERLVRNVRKVSSDRRRRRRG